MTNQNNEEINELSRLEQSSHQLLSQRQVFQSQLVETESALNEVNKTEKVYKIIGHIMVLSDKEKINEELKSKKDMLDIRIKSILNQEEKIKSKSNDLRKKVIKGFKE
jgi:prefoldin beta subunit